MAEALEVLSGLGVEWVAIHPYAGVRRDGTVRQRWASEADHLLRANEMIRAAGLRPTSPFRYVVGAAWAIGLLVFGWIWHRSGHVGLIFLATPVMIAAAGVLVRGWRYTQAAGPRFAELRRRFDDRRLPRAIGSAYWIWDPNVSPTGCSTAKPC